MDFIRKEEELLVKLKESGFAGFGGNKEQALDFVEEQLDNIFQYGAETVSGQIRSRFGGSAHGPEGDGVENGDLIFSRAAHGLDALNGLCADLGMDPFTDIDTGDKQAVAEFIGQCMRSIYNRGIGRRAEEPQSE